MQFNPSDKDMQDKEFLPIGHHVCYVASALYAPPADGKEAQLILELECIDPESSHRGKSSKAWITLSEKMRWVVGKVVNAIHKSAGKAWSPFDVANGNDLARIFYAGPLLVEVEENDYNGKKTERVANTGYASLVGKELDRLRAAYGQTLMPGGSSTPPPTSQAPPRDAVEDFGDDDTPM